jgi:hypothetical protein
LSARPDKWEHHYLTFSRSKHILNHRQSQRLRLRPRLIFRTLTPVISALLRPLADNMPGHGSQSQATLSVNRLWARQSHQENAGPRLAEIYRWVTPGLKDPD